MWKSVGLYLLRVIGAAYLGLLVMVIAQYPIKMLTADEVIRGISMSVACVIASLICLFVTCMKAGSDENKSGGKLVVGQTVMVMILAVAVYVLLTVIFRYYTGAATNVCILATVLGNIDASTDIIKLARDYGGWMFLSLIIQTIPFIPAMIIGYIVGGKMRRKKRRELLNRAVK
ncbi:MAG: hypothetical protein IJW92_05240 [Clostridia bacterium]|nr:hypothetical protein [Clostridia bacterium]